MKISYEIDQRVDFVTRFLWFCAGATPQLLVTCEIEKNKYQCIGAAVLFTGILAGFSGGYAFFTVFENIRYAVAFGVLWGAIMFNLDRFILISLESSSGFWRRLALSVPRILLAIGISIVISKPLELYIFRHEIDEQVRFTKQEELTQKKQELLETVAQFSATRDRELVDIEKESKPLVERYNTMIDYTRLESQGMGSDKGRGWGSIARGLKRDAEDYRATIAPNLAIIEKKRQEAITKYNNSVEGYNAQVKQIDNDIAKISITGFLVKLKALSTLGENNLAMGRAILFITLLIIALETAPVVAKLFSATGLYEEVRTSYSKNSLLAHMHRHEAKQEIVKDYENHNKVKEREYYKEFLEQFHNYRLDLLTHEVNNAKNNKDRLLNKDQFLRYLQGTEEKAKEGKPQKSFPDKVFDVIFNTTVSKVFIALAAVAMYWFTGNINYTSLTALSLTLLTNRFDNHHA